MVDQDFSIFITKIKSLTSIDLSLYKEAQMKRRLTTLRLRRGFSSFASYYEALEKDPKLLEEFLDRMTINVSEFWRNPNRWEILEKMFLPALYEENPHLKCWSAACSTGEEPYSLAMILNEMNALRSASVLASDLDQLVLRKAKEGNYSERSLRDVPDTYKRKYFEKTEDGLYRIDPKLTKAIQFEKMDLLHDPYGSNYDLIICRNVMIYFTEEAKHEMYLKFAKALRPGGILFVGSTEQIFNPAKYGLETAETFFYRKMKGA